MENKEDNSILTLDGRVSDKTIDESECIRPPEPNFFLAFADFGEAIKDGVEFHFRVKKTLLARIKYWLFCQFFPFKIIRWD